MLNNWLLGLSLTGTVPNDCANPVAMYEFHYENTREHGPEKPPPDDGYEFSGGGSGNGLGKLGLAMVLSSAVTGALSLRAEPGTEQRQNLGYATGGLFVGGVILLAIERAR